MEHRTEMQVNGVPQSVKNKAGRAMTELRPFPFIGPCLSLTSLRLSFKLPGPRFFGPGSWLGGVERLGLRATLPDTADSGEVLA